MNVAVSCLQSPKTARENLYHKYRSKLVINPHLDRALVSFQANRKLPFYRWMKYKEGFSAEFVRYVLTKLTKAAGVLLDPFTGTGAALFAARKMGWDSIGIEVLPVGLFAIEARLASENITPDRLAKKLKEIEGLKWADLYDPAFKLEHVPITEKAFPADTERAIAGFRAYCERLKDVNLRKVFDLACLSALEEVSYTRKDGQYLRWDHRAGKKRTRSNFDKGHIPHFEPVISDKLGEICKDLTEKGTKQGDLFEEQAKKQPGMLDLRRGSCLEMLPRMQSKSIDIVITSPPYCNRYDYTRTYALELVYLGAGEEQIKTLRQHMLSCTVENRAKTGCLRRLYKQHGRDSAFERVMQVFKEQEALQEVLDILREFGSAGKLNNANIPNMVNNYFLEMVFVVYEMARLLKSGGKIVMVNDNVRYAGEEIPVDMILSDVAEQFGMRTKYIWVLARGKGNSSQQMGTHGRSELRKCVYVWEKA